MPSNNTLLVSPVEYLDGEAAAVVKHEFLNGTVYAMAGGSPRHAEIAINILASFKATLRGTPCRPYNSDVLVHLRHGADERFYYPDVSVVCGPKPVGLTIDAPTVIVEVLSPSTERQDRGEKRDAYLRCESLQYYILVHSERVEVTLHSRAGAEWQITGFDETTDILSLPAIGAELSLADIYEE